MALTSTQSSSSSFAGFLQTSWSSFGSIFASDFNLFYSLSNKVSLSCSFLSLLCRDLYELSVEMSVEMPFEIRTLESPTHVIRTKVTLTMQSQ